MQILEKAPWVVIEDGISLRLADSQLVELRYHLAQDEIVTIRIEGATLLGKLYGQKAQEHHPIVAQHDTVSPARINEALHRLCAALPIWAWVVRVRARPCAIQAEPNALAEHRCEVLQIGGVIAMADVD
eukprot:CAMPEP_0180519176 /NCGR_PEP_ID=MMETSP1036_2-20121128/55525_1 /TAXON_ID=632150 /ORGANISM="Azadinium spinosum, Strain 3D9" /LENGTH=128 /DNA_ID=CAMNT_0022531451 /DNA_START=83 /DNA_END=467 /DNA_ORIENTATION=-